MLLQTPSERESESYHCLLLRLRAATTQQPHHEPDHHTCMYLLLVCSATMRAEFMRRLASVKDVVDTVSPFSYYIQQVPPHNLIRMDGADTVHRALQAAGFAVQPLVGDISGGWNMSWYRDTFASRAFADSAVKEIESGGLEGLNFDYEPHQPGNHNDSIAYMAMVQSIMDRSKAVISVDFPCNGLLCDPPTLATQLKGGKFIDMGTCASASTHVHPSAFSASGMLVARVTSRMTYGTCGI
jgi:hypothetical protein